jgi:mycofactocin biosynthesis protein MftB
VTASVDTDFDPSGAYALDAAVAIRPEPFGALAYHYGNRRLTFLRSPDLVALVRDVEHHGSADEALLAEARRGRDLSGHAPTGATWPASIACRRRAGAIRPSWRRPRRWR